MSYRRFSCVRKHRPSVGFHPDFTTITVLLKATDDLVAWIRKLERKGWKLFSVDYLLKKLVLYYGIPRGRRKRKNQL